LNHTAMKPSLFIGILVGLVAFNFVATVPIKIQEDVQASKGFWTWSCVLNATYTYNNTVEQICKGVMKTSSTGSIVVAVDLTSATLPVIGGYAVDQTSQLGYILMTSDPYDIDNTNFQTSIIVANVNTGAIQSTTPVSSSFYNFKSDQILATSFDSSSKNLYLLIQTNVQYPSMSNFKIVSISVTTGQFTIKLNSPLQSSNAFIYVSSALDATHGIYYVVMGSGSQGGWELYELNFQSNSVVMIPAPYGFVSIAYNPSSNGLTGTLFNAIGTANLMTYSPLTSSFTLFSNTSYVTNTTQWKYCGASSPLGALDQSISTYATMCCSDADGCSQGGVIQTVSLLNGQALSDSSTINWVNEIQFGLYWVTSN